jgi:hypothetical protein
LDVVGEA